MDGLQRGLGSENLHRGACGACQDLWAMWRIRMRLVTISGGRAAESDLDAAGAGVRTDGEVGEGVADGEGVSGAVLVHQLRAGRALCGGTSELRGGRRGARTS